MAGAAGSWRSPPSGEFRACATSIQDKKVGIWMTSEEISGTSTRRVQEQERVRERVRVPGHS